MKGANDFLDTYGINSSNYDESKRPYVVFDFDNTSSIFDIGDIYFVLQGSNENGSRTFSSNRKILRYGKGETILWRDGSEGDEQKLYNYLVKNKLTVGEFLNRFAVKTAADKEGNDTGLKHGFLKEYDGYKNLK